MHVDPSDMQTKVVSLIASIHPREVLDFAEQVKIDADSSRMVELVEVRHSNP